MGIIDEEAVAEDELVPGSFGSMISGRTARSSMSRRGSGGEMGSHRARFGEIESRGCALTRKGKSTALARRKITDIKQVMTYTCRCWRKFLLSQMRPTSSINYPSHPSSTNFQTPGKKSDNPVSHTSAIILSTPVPPLPPYSVISLQTRGNYWKT